MPDHSKDSDCEPFLVDDTCTVCGIGRTDKCPDCGAYSYHTDTCASADCGGPVPQSTMPDNVEIWEDEIATVECERCGDFDVPHDTAFATDAAYCPGCNKPARRLSSDQTAWWFWYCMPGCLPDSEPMGPYSSEAAAIKAAREDNEGLE